MTMLCRMCAGVAEVGVSFLDPAHQQTLQWTINKFKIELDDGLPKQMCMPCLEHVHKWYMFENRCKLAHKLHAANASARQNEAASAVSQPSRNASQDVTSCNLIDKFNLRELKVNLVKLSDSLIHKLTHKQCDDHSNSLACQDDSDLETDSHDTHLTISTDDEQGDSSCRDLQSKDIGLGIKERKNVSLMKASMSKPSTIKHQNSGLKHGNIKRTHEITHLNLSTVKCPLCEKTLSTKYIKNHVRNVHEAVKSFQCKYCLKSFKSKHILKRHLKVHSNERPFKCDKCSTSFKRKDNLTQHKRLLHNNVRPFVCKKCGKAFKYKTALSDHCSQVHSDVSAFTCAVCNKMFKSKDEVKYHMAVHAVELNFKCEHCDKKFRSKPLLSHHIKLHSTMRRFQCGQCEKRFKTRAYLSKHMRTHSEVRPFSCDICAKSFKIKSTLKLHGLVHSNVRHFKCDLCPAKFKQKTELNRHVKNVHFQEK